MKVLLLNTHTGGGAARACLRLHLGLLKAGINSKLLTRYGDPTMPEVYGFQKDQHRSLAAKAWLQLRHTLHQRRWQAVLKNLPQGFEAFQSNNSIYDLTTHPLYGWADVINLHWVAEFLDYPTFFKHNHKPLVWTLHDMLPFTGGYHYEVGFPIEAYADLIDQQTQQKAKALSGQNLHVVAPNQWMRHKSIASSLFSPFPHELIPYGIDTNLFRPYHQNLAKSVFNLPTEQRIVLFVADSVHNARKGFSLLHDALKILNLPDVHLAVIGSHSENLADLPQLTVLGRIQDDRLLALAYAAADLFVIPSIEDNLPNTVIESLACGTPVAGFAIGGIPDMVQDGHNGFLSPEVSAAGLAEVILRALAYPFDRAAIREDAVARFDQSVQATRYIELFKTLLPTTGETNA